MPSFTNPDYENLPEQVQALVDGLPSEQRPPRCSSCRGAFEGKPLRCSRCTVAHYCSKECQKQHFGFHKSLCKLVGKQTDRLMGGSSDQQGESLVPESIAAAIMLQLADALVVMGYRESDTVINGSFYYRRALHYYMEAYKILKGSFFDRPELEDKALILMMALGGDYKIMMQWCMCSGSPRLVNFMPPTVEAPPEFKTQGFAGNDYTFQSLCLLSSMRSLSQYRRDQQAFETFLPLVVKHTEGLPELLQSHVLPYLLGDTKDGRLDMDSLPENIALTIAAIRHHGNGETLEHLRDSHPFTSQHAPDLVRNATAVPPEFWGLYQDCFFLTPGLYNVLAEFVPEDE